MLQVLLFLTILKYALPMCTTELNIGGPKKVDPHSQSVIDIAVFAAQEYSQIINADFALNNVISGTSQVVAGELYVLNVQLKDNNCINGQQCDYQDCSFRVLNQVWMPVPKTLLKYQCGSVYMI